MYSQGFQVQAPHRKGPDKDIIPQMGMKREKNKAFGRSLFGAVEGSICFIPQTPLSSPEQLPPPWSVS